MNRSKPVAFAVAGMGGFGRDVTDQLLKQAACADAPVRMVCVCDPAPQKYAERTAALREAGVQVFSRFEDLLAQPIQAIWLPLPIELHRSYTERALAAGKAVLVEKPASASVDDVNAMIAARDAHRGFVAVGFQDIYQPAFLDLKRRLLSGEFGRTRELKLIGCWPRGERYYNRASWAGKLRHNGGWVLDGPATNAIAHYVHLPLFLMGPSLNQSAAPQFLQAELYRTNPIESYDTCCFRMQLTENRTFVAALTHACQQQVDGRITILTERATIVIRRSGTIEINHIDRPRETLPLDPDRHRHVIRTCVAHIRNQPDAPPIATLEMARMHTITVNGMLECSAIHPIPDSAVDVVQSKAWGSLRAIRGIEPVLEKCVAEGKLLSECGQADWAKPAGEINLVGYQHFRGPKAE